ncbi:MAG: hypothetical protein CMJ64_04385 [Planctomycetaceae bacterium]|jgi:PAS domain S-box-containing protein|nr:hypothetical protein [Planctomycetaceae bacterium]
MGVPSAKQRRVLVVDDKVSIHEDFRHILCRDEDGGLEATKSLLLGTPLKKSLDLRIQLECAAQGLDGVEMIRLGVEEGNPFLLAFVDVRMPPGIDGIETISRMWEIDPDLHAVICTAFSDYTWEETIENLGNTDRLLILKKPFDITVVRQLSSSLLTKSELAQRIKRQVSDMAREMMSTRMIIDMCNDAYLQTDEQGRVVIWSRKAEAFFGWSFVEAQGRQLQQFLKSKSPSEGSYESWLNRLTEHASGERVEMVAVARDGVEFPVEVSIAPMQIDGLSLLNAFVHDISDPSERKTNADEALALPTG